MPMNARVTILHDVAGRDMAAEAGEPQAEPDSTQSFEAEMLVLEQPVMDLLAQQNAERGTAVRVDTAEAIWLGEVTECVASGGGFALRIRLRHVLRDFGTLARLAERFGTGAATKGVPVRI
jgi:hypothetical protein